MDEAVYFNGLHRLHELDINELLYVNNTNDMQGRCSGRGFTLKGKFRDKILDTRHHNHSTAQIHIDEALCFNGLYGVQELDNKELLIINNTYDT